jgi:glycosyltransferase involved in cell wall biosynthesis
VRERAPAPPAFAVVHEAVVIPSNARTLELADVPRDPEAGRMLFVGRLDRDKGAHTVVQALGVLEREHGVRATLRLVGDGTREERRALERLAMATGVAERVTFTGPCVVTPSWPRSPRRTRGASRRCGTSQRR